ncbi:zinc finger protein CONSTANS-LIKE 5-like [Dioscorea cayenensis subsp. rotundata]|uniref:Zinc finger protein CONSTANS-LIKE 5-like n=1 Tax=Dioscorea cayennensis subsp. rotundata TaxID=55577 RepID=A0AB40C9W6_DIOCR|nr:zinc finger protein CONSTANS-LIKE 5-like [Dioscorea cayenensis subsp. rotundata]
MNMNHHHQIYSYSTAPKDDSPDLLISNTFNTPLPPSFKHHPFSSSSSSSSDFIDSSLRHSFSAEDIQLMNGMQSLSDNGGQDGNAIFGKVGRYSAEERKERIERYRSKRNQRNFQKKITYACRKTLADSRPRVRGRFARNGETETETEAETESNIDNGYAYVYDYGYGYGYGSSSVNYDNGDGNGEYFWRPENTVVKEEIETDDRRRYDEDDSMWTSFLDEFSMNLPS